jgi:transposase
MRSKGSAAQLEYRRQLGARLLAQGKGVREIARWLAVAPSSVSRWKQALARGGQQALRAKAHPGGSPRLSPQQKARLLRELAKGPRAAGFPTELWTCPRVAAVIARRFGVHYPPAHVWRLLRRLLWSPQQPAHRARERDEAAIARWRTRTWPRLKKSAAA